jgi:predicted DNA-binding transcriptional regulator AlpA
VREHIPEHAFLTKAEVLKILRRGRTALNNAMRRGTFPRPVELSERSSLWRRDDIVAWAEGTWKPEADEFEAAE